MNIHPSGILHKCDIQMLNYGLCTPGNLPLSTASRSIFGTDDVLVTDCDSSWSVFLYPLLSPVVKKKCKSQVLCTHAGVECVQCSAN